MQGATLDDDCYRLEIEGAPSVFEGLRSLVDDGLAEAGPRTKGVRCGLPEWMWGAMHGGETVVELEEVVQEGEPEAE